MGNIKNYNFNQLDLKLSNYGYWDFYLANDTNTGNNYSCGFVSTGDCLVAYYDFNNSDIFSTGSTSANTIYSLVSWDNAVNTGYTFNTIGLTGIDNGLITYNKLSGDTSNTALVNALTGSSLSILSAHTELILTKVTGSTGQFIYPVNIINDSSCVGDYAQFCGGFYQGFYKIDGSTYQVLPIRANQSWSAQFWLNRDESLCSSGETGTTLNDIYPDNKGFFFYMGTRAENKFWNTFEGLNTGCTSGCTADSGCTDTVTNWCTIPKENEISILSDYGTAIPLNPPLVEFEIITNKFLLFGRAYGDGLGTRTVCCPSDAITIIKYSENITNTTNPFLIFGRARSGTNSCHVCGYNHDGYGTQTICSFTGYTEEQKTLDYKLDIIDNALGFRIKDDGSIGYRLLTQTGACINDVYTSGVTIEEGYSVSGMVATTGWTNVVIRFVTNEYYDDCELLTKKPRKGKLMFYVNSKLKYVVHDFDEFVARRLNEYKGKQVGVPFNISLGGGSQGLIESQTFDGSDPSDANLPIEKNFAGTFIGGISQFKLNMCDLNWCDIQCIYNSELPRYLCNNDTNLILSEDGFIISSEDGYGIIWT